MQQRVESGLIQYMMFAVMSVYRSVAVAIRSLPKSGMIGIPNQRGATLSDFLRESSWRLDLNPFPVLSRDAAGGPAWGLGGGAGRTPRPSELITVKPSIRRTADLYCSRGGAVLLW